MANTEVERYTGVDVEDVPSEGWGWSRESPRVIHVFGIVIGIFLLTMLRGNHTGRVEDIFVILFAVGIFFFVGRDWWLRRRGWTR